MKNKVLKILSCLATACMGFIGVIEFNHFSLLFFGEPEIPAELIFDENNN